MPGEESEPARCSAGNGPLARGRLRRRRLQQHHRELPVAILSSARGTPVTIVSYERGTPVAKVRGRPRRRRLQQYHRTPPATYGVPIGPLVAWRDKWTTALTGPLSPHARSHNPNCVPAKREYHRECFTDFVMKTDFDLTPTPTITLYASHTRSGDTTR